MDQYRRLGESFIRYNQSRQIAEAIFFNPEDAGILPDLLKLFCRYNNLGKATCFVPETALQPFLDEGYVIEGRIPEGLKGLEMLYFVSAILEPGRSRIKEQHHQRIRSQLKEARKERARGLDTVDMPSVAMREMKQAESGMVQEFLTELADESIHFKVGDALHIQNRMGYSHRFFGAFHQDRLVSVVSLIFNISMGTAEISEVATLMPYRGQGLASYLLAFAEGALSGWGIHTLWCHVPTGSEPLNGLMARGGFRAAGILKNHFFEKGRFESRSLWYKRKNLSES